MLTLPNLLTWTRILAIPMFIGIFYLPDHLLTLHEKNLWATVLFTAAAITDWLDGWLARRLNQLSAFGAFLDPVADKLMVAAALIVLVEIDRASAIVAVIIIGREITISALREWMAQIGASTSVAVNFLGKIKTVSQMIAIPMLLYHDALGAFNTKLFGDWLIWLAAALTLVSMAYYLKLALPQALAQDRRKED